MNLLKGKVAIVTGVSRREGIGAAICRKFASEGADVFFTHYRDYEKRITKFEIEENWTEVFSRELRQFGSRVENMELDLSDSNAPNQLLDKVEKTLNLPSILVNNATHCVAVDYNNLKSEILDEHYYVNVRGTCMLSVLFAKRIKQMHPGSIVNLISGQDKGPQPGNLAYVTTKGAISAFTKSLASEIAQNNITVNAVDPGPTNTGWMTDDIQAHILPKFPMGRIGVPDDAARIISFLASEEARWITGQIIHSDGGFWD